MKYKIRINIAFRIIIALGTKSNLAILSENKNAWRHIRSKHFYTTKISTHKNDFLILKNLQKISGESPLNEEIERKID